MPPPTASSDVFARLRFRWPWRPYQQRALDAAEVHAADGRVHIVAAPGAGKTVLGLEIVRRLARPALVFSPTLTIRDQWIARLGDFSTAPDAQPQDWVSTDLDALRTFNSVTYQSLHAKHRAERDADDVGAWEEALESAPSATEMQRAAQMALDAGIGTLVLDEAHHLRQEWWKALAALVDGLPDLTLVALTATPPYDVASREWRRYEELCGPIDEEVSVPELVRSETLCPHQDYVWAVAPGSEDISSVRSHDRTVTTLMNDLETDAGLRNAVALHHWLTQDELDEEAVLDDPEQAVALLVYLAATSEPNAPLLDLLDIDAHEIPPLDRRWWTVLLQRYLYDDAWGRAAPDEAARRALARRLRDCGLLWRRRLRLDASKPMQGLLAQSPEKIGACVSIHQLEREVRGEDLRQAILTDFIRDEGPGPNHRLRLGARPVFRALVDSEDPSDRSDVALLTGRRTEIHASRIADLERAMGAEARRLTTQPSDIPDFVRITAPQGGRLVAPMTALFDAGQIRCLVGTRALLGEGWDAPELNSLVLASYVGSFMLTNQMRGRAIRRSKQNHEKRSSIWHLVAVDPGTESGLGDWQGLAERFRTFVGPSAGGLVIESGLGRLAIPPPDADSWHPRVNETMARRLRDDADLAGLWREALAGATESCVAPSVDVARVPRLRQQILASTFKHVLWLAGCTFLAAFARSLSESHPRSIEQALLLVAFAALVGAVIAAPSLFRAARLFIRTLPIDGSLQQVARALLHTMVETGLIESSPHRLDVRVRPLADERVTVSLAGGSVYERSLFADALAEILSPIENPRYLITRTGTWLWKRTDHHAVPTILGAKKERAMAFHAAWQRNLGRSELVFTRNKEGRRTLVQARARSFAAGIEPDAARSDRWV